MSKTIKVLYRLEDGSSLLYTNPSNLTLGRVKEGSCRYNKLYYDANFMLVKVLEDVKQGDVLFVDGINGVKNFATAQFGIATIDCPANCVVAILLKGVADLKGDYGLAGDNVYLQEGEDTLTLSNESTANQVLGANFLAPDIVRFYDI